MSLTAGKRRITGDVLVPYLLCLPMVVFIGLLFMFPVLRMLALSFVSESGHGLTLSRYTAVIADPYYIRMAARTIWISGLTTLVTLVIAYPVALQMRQVSPKWRATLAFCMLSPLLTSVVVRTLAWNILLAPSGVLNRALAAIGLPSVALIYNTPGVVIGMTHVFFGYMVLSLLTSLLNIDENVLLAATNLGATRWEVFRRIVWPLTLPGVVSGCLLVFTLCASSYVTPAMLGGTATKMLAMEVYDLAIVEVDWEAAAVISLVLFVLIMAMVWALGRAAASGKRRVIFE
jgi:putative spermidine/putrescine transport system permease protein